VKYKIAALSAISFATFFAGHAFAYDYPDKMTGRAAIACNFEADLVFNRKLDLVDKYVTPDFVDHNAMVDAKDAAAFKEGLSKLPKFNDAPSQGCGGAKVVLQTGDYVMFIRETMTPNPKDATKKIMVTHFDLWRFEGNKIAEHWD
jgi:predicted SnoaL-like aldol condensation-catalyzing enzyme